MITEMQNAYLRPNERTYGIIINGYIAAGLIEESLPLLERMKMEGISPTIAIFNHLVKGYSEAMQPEGIDKVNKSISLIPIPSQNYMRSIPFFSSTCSLISILICKQHAFSSRFSFAKRHAFSFYFHSCHQVFELMKTSE